MTTLGDNGTIDGRRARRERGRLAVVDAAIDLVVAHDRVPAVETIAQRAGVSVASIFRYFDSVDELHRQTAARYYERYHELFTARSCDDDSLDTRIDGLVDARITLWSTIGPIARLVRARAYDYPPLAELLAEVRRDLTRQVRARFRPELAAMGDEAGRHAVTAIALVTSYESWTQYHGDAAMGPDAVRAAWIETIRRCLR